MPVKLIIRWRPLALLALVVIGLILRIYGINWDQGNSFHPDERQILFRVMTLSWPSSLAQFFNSEQSPLNPHFFAYGSFPLYLLALLGNIVMRFSPTENPFVTLMLTGRVLAALFDAGTILLTGLLALRLTQSTAAGRGYAWQVALLAAALVIFTPLQLQLAHFFVVESMLLFFILFTVYACVVLVETERPTLWACITGLSYGLALATKFSAAPLAVPLFVAICIRWYRRRDLLDESTTLLVTGLVSVITFVLAQPYALLDMPNFIQQVAEQGNLVRGTLDLPYVRQFAGTIPGLYQVQNLVLWGMGVMLGLAALAGLLWSLWRVWRREAGLWLVVLSWVVVYSAITISFYVKFMRYMLPIYPFLTLMAAAVLVTFVRFLWQLDDRKMLAGSIGRRLAPLARFGSLLLIPLVLAGTIFQGLALLNVYSQPNTRVQASSWMYEHLSSGSVITYEQWDDPLPIALGANQPEQFIQATYTNVAGQPTTGMDLYGEDTPEKAGQLAKLLPEVNVIVISSDRLLKSIPKLPFRYPMTIRYYDLLFSGELGFRLAAKFENRPNLFGIALDDSNADESYSVFDHPTVHIFVRDTPYPYTSEQLLEKLTDGIELPASGANLSGVQRSLLLSQQQIQEYQQSPPLAQQFPAESFVNAAPVLVWWLVLVLLGLLAYPLVFPALRSLADAGYIFGKTIGVLVLAYLAWMLASLHILPFQQFSLLLVLGLLALASLVAFLVQRRTITAFILQHKRLLLLEELVFSLAFLLFVGIRSLNPDAWNPFIGGEKPMELAFLHAILRSPYMPPIDPWFSGGYLNYYYYSYVIFGALIKLTGILPTTAFNLAMPTLFAMTFSGAAVIVYSFTRRLLFALLGGYFTALIGNFQALAQIKEQVLALLTGGESRAFSYWDSSRIIPNTINEFPFWSFLFADLHPHVVAMPITVCMLGILAAMVLSARKQGNAPQPEQRRERGLLYLYAAFVFGTVITVNTWDLPVHVLLLSVVFMTQIFREQPVPKQSVLLTLFYRSGLLAGLYALGYLFYLPFYVWYQQLYVNGLGLVRQSTAPGDYLLIFGLWFFLALSLFLVDFYRKKVASGNYWKVEQDSVVISQRIGLYILLCLTVLIAMIVLDLRLLLGALLLLGTFLFFQTLKTDRRFYTYLLVLVGLAITLGQDIVYVRDFLDGSEYERMNTVFKFSMPAWICLAIGGALAVYTLWRRLRGSLKRVWTTMLFVFVASCSLFLPAGSIARIQDHYTWKAVTPPVVSADYTPTLDGFAFARSWYPGDAKAITWLNTHVSGSPVILEVPAPESYRWYNRVSAFTGLPAVLGWPDHVSQQRYGEQSWKRLADVNTVYTTKDQTTASILLHQYHVRYIYVGDLEREVYAKSIEGLDKFANMSDLRVVYNADGVIIYEVLEPGKPSP